MLQFTSHRNETTLIHPDEIVAVRQSGGDFEGSAIIVLRNNGPGRVSEIFVKENSTQVSEALLAHLKKPRPPVIAVEVLSSPSERFLSAAMTELLAKGWVLDGPTTTAQKFKSDEDMRRNGATTLFIQRLVKYA